MSEWHPYQIRLAENTVIAEAEHPNDLAAAAWLGETRARKGFHHMTVRLYRWDPPPRDRWTHILDRG